MAANQTWVWIDPAVILAVHDEQLAEHGGAAGVRDAGLLESALARPRNLAHYGQPDACELAQPTPSGWRRTTRSSTATSARHSSPPNCS